MKLPFGFMLIRERAMPPTAEELEDRLHRAVEHLNVLWKECRDAKLKLSLWLDWTEREIIVTEPAHKKKEPRQ
jgi:hypothetical protein